MRKILLATALTLALAPLAQAKHGLDLCDVESDYNLRIDEASLTFSRHHDAPRTVAISRGRLTVDGEEIAVSAADRARLADFEATVRELIPEVKAIALEGVAIGFSAVETVARTFAGNPAATAEHLATLRIAAERKLEEGFDQSVWDSHAFERYIEETVESMVPAIAGEIAGQAIAVALSGNEDAVREIEAKAKRLERTIEREVEERAKALERRAESLCPAVAELEEIESALELRLADDSRLDLVRLDR